MFLGASGVIFLSFLFHFFDECHVSKQNEMNRIAQDGTPCLAAPHLWLFCLPMFKKRTPDLYVGFI